MQDEIGHYAANLFASLWRFVKYGPWSGRSNFKRLEAEMSFDIFFQPCRFGGPPVIKSNPFTGKTQSGRPPTTR